MFDLVTFCCYHNMLILAIFRSLFPPDKWQWMHSCSIPCSVQRWVQWLIQPSVENDPELSSEVRYRRAWTCHNAWFQLWWTCDDRQSHVTSNGFIGKTKSLSSLPGCFVWFFIEPDNSHDIILLEVIKVALGWVVNRSKFCTGTNEGQKLLWYQPIKIPVSHLLVLFVFGNVKVVEVEETECCCFLNGIQTVYEIRLTCSIQVSEVAYILLPLTISIAPSSNVTSPGHVA